MHQQGLTVQDLTLLGYSDVKEDSKFVASDICLVYNAVAAAGVRQVSATFIYFKSRATRAQADEILSKMQQSPDLYVVVPLSTMNRPEIPNLCRTRKVECFVHEDLIWKRVETLMKEYVKSLSESIIPEKYFVQPRRDDDSKSELDQELIDFMTGKEQNKKGNLLVLSASAGVGKTTLARHLTKLLAERSFANRVIPIYVESQHWSKIQFETIDGLWDVIANSLKTYNSSLNLTQEIFEHMLKIGYVSFIFDGFDELCGHRHFTYRAGDVLKDLASLAKASDAKLLLTTRTAYWETEISNPPENLIIVPLAPFNTQQAKGYFAKYFKGKDDKIKQEQAISLYQELTKRIQPPTSDGSKQARSHFANLPLCVGLVAECVRLGTVNSESFIFDKGIIYSFLSNICEREQERQKLIANKDRQLLMFQETAMEYVDASTPEFDKEELEIMGLEKEDSAKMVSHPLLQKTPEGRLRFAYDFLPHYFKACDIVHYLVDHKKEIQKSSLKLMTIEANGKGFVFDHIVEICKEEKFKALATVYMRLPATAKDEKSFLFHLAHVFSLKSKEATTKKEKSRRMFEYLLDIDIEQKREIGRLVMIGKIEDVDFSGICFKRCDFIDTVFVKCDVNNKTEFQGCSFSGEFDFINCDPSRWAEVRIDEKCNMYSPVNLIWEKFIGTASGNKEEHVKDALRLALSKFWKHGRLQPTLRKENWTTGSLGHSIYCKPTLDAMLKVGVLKEGAAGRGEYVFDRESLADLQRFMDGRQLTGTIRDVYEKILLTR